MMYICRSKAGYSGRIRFWFEKRMTKSSLTNLRQA